MVTVQPCRTKYTIHIETARWFCMNRIFRSIWRSAILIICQNVLVRNKVWHLLRCPTIRYSKYSLAYFIKFMLPSPNSQSIAVRDFSEHRIRKQFNIKGMLRISDFLQKSQKSHFISIPYFTILKFLQKISLL